MKASNYRPEIEGLRAVAVLAVVFFHIQPMWLGGGFVGVDVFFVISGYLITSIIVRQSEAGTFSFKDFWLRRMRRLFPALAVVLICTLIAGYFTLIGDEWTSLGSQMAAVLLLVGNFQMWQLANNYWGQTAQDTPLLHTWSLAVEEQFYLLYPLALVLLIKVGRRAVLPTLVGVLVVSFVVSLYATSHMPAAAFYLLPARAWELLIGCVLAIAQTRLNSVRPSSALTLVGILMVVVSCIFIDGSIGFPGFKALLPTIGAALILAFAGRSERPCVTTRLLSHPACTYVGRISYSLYLWHWPLIVFSHWYGVHPVWVVGGSFALASLSYHLVEAPLRHNVRLQWYLPSAALVMFAVAVPIHFNMFSPKGLPAALAFVDAPVVDTRGQGFEAKFLLNKGGVLLNCDDGKSPKMVLFGSSHARVLSRPFADYANKRSAAVSLLGCSHLAVSDIRSPEAQIRMAWIEKWQPEVVVVAGRWDQEVLDPSFEEGLRDVLQRMSSWTSRCIVLGQVPLIETNEKAGKNLKKFLITEYRRIGKLPALKSDSASTEASARVREIVASLQDPGLVYVEAGNPLLEGGVIQAVQNGTLLYADQDHLNDAGAAVVFERSILPAFGE